MVVSTDPRVSYSVDDASCSTIIFPNVLRVLPNASCTKIVVTATATWSSVTLMSTAVVPVVYRQSAEVRFHRYPLTSLSANELGLVHCFSDVYHAATPLMQAILTDGSIVDVTRATTFTSNDSAVVGVSGSGTSTVLWRPVYSAGCSHSSANSAGICCG